MSVAGNGGGRAAGGDRRRALDTRIEARRRADAISGLRGLSRRRRGWEEPDSGSGPSPLSGFPAAGKAGRTGGDLDEWCELCGAGLPAEHRHLIELGERRLLCACETCWSVRSGEPQFRPAGVRTEWLADFDLPDEVWAGFGIPIGLAFFMRTGAPDPGGAVKTYAFYPSPAGATEARIDDASWRRVVDRNPMLGGLEADSEALLVSRMSEPHQYAIAPIDDCYRLVGMIKSAWEGISGGEGPELAIARFFAELRVQSVVRDGDDG